MLWGKVLNFSLICQSWLKTELYILREPANCSLEVWLMPSFTPGEVGGHIICSLSRVIVISYLPSLRAILGGIGMRLWKYLNLSAIFPSMAQASEVSK